MESHEERGARYRELAAQMRAEAASAQDQYARDVLLSIAGSYEKLAAMADGSARSSKGY